MLLRFSGENVSPVFLMNHPCALLATDSIDIDNITIAQVCDERNLVRVSF